MTTTHGFRLLHETHIPDLNTYAKRYIHEKTGAELLSLENDDENKVFGITFRTPYPDSTGMAHIMEHSVLCGSRKYPVKEPFIELVKGSLQTFLNAFTFPDKTCYPVASTNHQDFYNLVDVYLDAVFYPLISDHILAQEGWHFEKPDGETPMTIKGVVYNEMKGAYSSPDNLMYRYSRRALFPDNVYQYDSGGDPHEIPELTYAAFKEFHRTRYHPSNARIYFYGDDDPENRLQILDAYLRVFDQIEVDTQVDLQPRFDMPRRMEIPYDAGEDAERKAIATVNWLLTENTNPELTLSLDILEYILLGTPAAPLRKAMIDSGLGEDVTGSGLDTQLRQLAFSVGMKGMRLEDVAPLEDLIINTLGRLAEDGIDPAAIEASLNTIEFQLRENNTGSFPRGLMLMLRALSTWNYGQDPLAPLYYEKTLGRIRTALQNGDRLFEDLIKIWLIENPHRVTVLLRPDAEEKSRAEAAEKARIQAALDQMTDHDLQKVEEQTQLLKTIQDTPDAPENLAKIPTLKLSDLNRENKRLPIEISQVEGVPLLVHDLFTNGIAYLDVGFDLHALPEELLPYIPLFSRALTEMGTTSQDYVQFIQRIGAKTGGIGVSQVLAPVMNARQDAAQPGQLQSAAWLVVRSKATLKQVPDLVGILTDMLLAANFNQPERFRQMVFESKARKESGLAPGGSGVVASRLRARFHEADWLSECMGGIDSLFFTRHLAEMVVQDWESVLEKLERIRSLLFNQRAMILNLTLDQANHNLVVEYLRDFVTGLPSQPPVPQIWTRPTYPPVEGMTMPAQVNYVGKAANLYEHGYEYHGSMNVVRRYMGTTYLWEKVRVQGGAYGGGSGFTRGTGTFIYTSYRDPNLLTTLEAYDGSVEFLRNLDLSQSELTRSIIGAIGDMDAYMLPDARGYTSFLRHLTGITEDELQKTREQILGTTSADFNRFADALALVSEHGQVAVLGSPEAIQEADEARGGGWFTITKVL